MMANRVVGLGLVTLCADAITLGNEFIGVGIVAVTADNPRLRHFALHK